MARSWVAGSLVAGSLRGWLPGGWLPGWSGSLVNAFDGEGLSHGLCTVPLALLDLNFRFKLKPRPMSIVERPSLSLLVEPDVVANPYPVLAALRAASPYTAIDDALVVLGGHADCSRILRDPRVSSERGRSRLVPPDSNRRFGMSFLSMDPPDHTRLRGLVAKAFTPRVIAALAPRIREVTAELLATAAARDPHELEVVSQLAYPLPVRIICELLGVPAGDQHRFAGWSARLAHSLPARFIGNNDEQVADAAAARIEFADYFRELVAQRRAQPGADLLTELIRAEDKDHRLTEAELLATSILLLVAGHETTVGLISNAVLALLRHPDHLAALRDDPCPGRGQRRGDPAVRPAGAAHRAGRPGQDPDRGRDGHGWRGDPGPAGRHRAGSRGVRRARPVRHQPTAGGALAFAAGPHFCLGAPLARLEASIAVTAFARQLAGPALDGLSYKPNFNLRGPERLVVRTAGIRPASLTPCWPGGRKRPSAIAGHRYELLTLNVFS